MKKRISVIVTVLIAATVVTVLSIFTVLATQTGASSDDALLQYLASVKGKETTLDSSRSFSVLDESASTVPGGKLTFTYSGATVGSNEYISVIITDSTGKALKYIRVKSVSSSAGQFELSLPALSVSTSYNLFFFSEQCTSSGEDKASKFSEVSLLIFNDPYILTTAPQKTTKGVNYSYQLMAATTASSCTWQVNGLPKGLKLDTNTGIIEGTPIEQGTFNLNVRVKTNLGGTSQSALTIKVNPPISITLSTDLVGVTGSKIEVPKGRTVLLSATISGGTPEYSSYSWLLEGDAIDGANSTTYKVPTSNKGTFTYTFTVADTAMANARQSITITVRDPIAPTLTYSSLVFDKAAPSAIQLTKSDGDYTVTGKIISGSKTLTVVDGDFTITDNTITLPISTLKGFALGDHTLTLDYDDTTADPSFTLSVIDSSLPPEVGRISTPGKIDRGNRLSLTTPTVTTNGTAVTSQGWEIKPIGTTNFVKFDPNTTLECSYNGASLRYYATNKAGTTTSNTVIITVDHTPKAKWQYNATEHWHECICGETFDTAAHERNSSGCCTVCGHYCKHDFSSYVSNNDAKCTADGTKTRTCSKCGYKETVTDAGTATGHQWSGWQVSPTQHWRVCLKCSAKSELGDHTPGVPATAQTPQVCTTCGTVLADRLTGETTTMPSGGDTTAPSGSETTTTPSGSETTTVPSGSETTAPSGGETTTAPSGSGTTTAPSGNETTAPSGGDTTPSGGTTTPSGNGTTSPDSGSDTSTPGGENDTNKVINITRKDDDSDDKPSFKTDTDISDSTLITVDGRPFTRDEYTISPDGHELELNPSNKLDPGKHTLVIETPYGRGETTFTIGDSNGSSFPFWTLWVIPHVFVDIAGLICIALLAIKRDDDKDDDGTGSKGADGSK